jgi:hypothetical protein
LVQPLPGVPVPGDNSACSIGPGRPHPTPPHPSSKHSLIVPSVRLRIAQRAPSEPSKSRTRADARLLRPVPYPFPSLSRRPHPSSVHYRLQTLHSTLLHPGVATLRDGRTRTTTFRSHNTNIHPAHNPTHLSSAAVV